MFDKILIANRGEIARRVARTCRLMGIKAVAVYSDADMRAPLLRECDQAVHIGPAEAKASYLNMNALLSAASTCGAQAIHPGYGFLSENAAFAEACTAADIEFIGPSAAAMRTMGSKAAAKHTMEAAGVPVVPGYHGEQQDDTTLAAAANQIGYPILLKAWAGGGGKGMRLAHTPDEFAQTLKSARREAAAAFGDDRMLVERFVNKPRHIEVQIAADKVGHTVHLFERDCSAQRRHQKVLEEAPAVGLSEETRQGLYNAAVAAARAVHYYGVGTVEFVLDPYTEEFFFLEMNTRLQVEHPVTEFVTGFDLVEWQLRIAAGQDLPRSQDQIRLNGHAVEVRLYAEDPAAGFLPCTGKISHLCWPPARIQTRIESGVDAGSKVGVHYDPMLAKVIQWDDSRDKALRGLSRSLKAIRVAGLTTNLEFLKALVDHPRVISGDIDTGYIDEHLDELCADRGPPPSVLMACALFETVRHEKASFSPWDATDGFTPNLAAEHRYTLNFAGLNQTLTLRRRGNDFLVETDDWEGRGTLLSHENDRVEFMEDSARRSVFCHTWGSERLIYLDGLGYRLKMVDDARISGGHELGAQEVRSPMPGKVIEWLVKPGTRVAEGQPLMVLEAMKMEHQITAPHDGLLSEMFFAPGSMVEDGAELLVVQAEG